MEALERLTEVVVVEDAVRRLIIMAATEALALSSFVMQTAMPQQPQPQAHQRSQSLTGIGFINGPATAPSHSRDCTWLTLQN
jgi:hypothetical protein